jgi:hypothetical protein
MHILLRGVLVFIFTALLCTSCTYTALSVSLALPSDVQETGAYPASTHTSITHASNTQRYAPLKALNRNARAGTINAPEESGALYYAFEKSPEMLNLTASGLYALELEFEPLPAAAKSGGTSSSAQTHSAEFIAGLLYASDFTASGKLKKNILPQHPVTAQTLPRGAFTVSIGFAGIAAPPADIRGFMVYSQAALTLKSAAVVPVRYGWLKDSTLWYGTAADGGVIPPELCTESGLPLRTELPKPTAVIRAGNAGMDGRDSIVIHFDKSLPIRLEKEQQQPRLWFQCGGKRISVYRAPELYQLTLDGSLFPESFLTLEQTGAEIPENTVCGITAEYYAPSPSAPITADPGLILDWPQTQWRQSSYELFAWEQFPSVLIFDFADYAVQDAYLKRMSFFAEKKGFTGKLLSDNTIASLHGFNAHDYRAETLAAFFRKAEEEHFPLNKSELHLRKILFHNGIIVRTEQGIEEGSGAIVSISRQSTSDLRYRFITHECLHGIYFTQESFRNMTAEVFKQTDARAVLFLRRYFELYSRLLYNTDDTYLLQNEFMAYLLQQGSGFLQQYYNQIAQFRLMNEMEPTLCRYMRDTNAEAFMQAAMQMSSFLYTAWGVRGGRIYLARMETL